MLILMYLRPKSIFGGSLSNFIAFVRQQLFVSRALWTWLNDPLQDQPALLAVDQLGLGL